MLDARSGLLLTSRSFQENFSQLQFADNGVSYLLHKAGDSASEAIELHHMDITTGVDTLVTQFTHLPQAKARPSIWRGSLSPDSSLLAYQHDVREPVITVVDGKKGTTISQIRWNEDLTPLAVHFDPQNQLIAIQLSSWDVRYNYGPVNQLIVAHLNTGEIMGKYPAPCHVRHVWFRKDHLVLFGNDNSVGHLALNSTAIVWKKNDDKLLPGINHHFLANENTAAYISRKNGDDAGEFRLLNHDGSLTASNFTLEKGFLPIGLTGKMLVSEKNAVRELPEWLQKFNDRIVSLFGRYLVSPLEYTIRYLDTETGELLAEYRDYRKDVTHYATRHLGGKSTLAAIYLDEDHLLVELSEAFPFWTMPKIGTTALLLTLMLAAFRAKWCGSTTGSRCL